MSTAINTLSATPAASNEDNKPIKMRNAVKKTVLATTASLSNAKESKIKVTADSDLPTCFKNVYKSIDSLGNEDGSIVIEAEDKKGRVALFKLDLMQLAKRQYDALATLVVKVDVLEHLSPKRLRELCYSVLRAAKPPMYLATRDGVHAVEVDGQRSIFIVHRGKQLRLGDKPPIMIGVALADNYLPPALGDLSQWQEQVGVHLKGNPKLIVPVLAAASALLIRIFNLSPLLLSIVGPSSIGKTTGLRVAMSLHSSAREIENFSGTLKGIRVFLEQLQDCPAFFDEFHMMEDVEGFVQLIFALGNNASRKTSTSDQKVSVGAVLSRVLITASEKTLEEITAFKRITLTEGISARYFEMIVSSDSGIFQTLPPGVTAKQFADHLSTVSSSYSGAFWDAWVKEMSRNYVDLKVKLPRILQSLEAKLLEGFDVDDRVTLRMVKGMAVWACAGSIAIKTKLLNLKPDQVIDALRSVLREHLERQSHKMTPIAEQIINHVRDIIDRQSSRFLPVSMFHSGEQNGMYGYTKGQGNERIFLFLPSVFKELVGDLHGTEMAAQALKSAGYLLTDTTGFQHQVHIPSKNGEERKLKRFYAVKESIRIES